MEREGLLVDSQTLWDQLEALARQLSPAHEALHACALTREMLGADETRWPLLGKSQTQWHAWGLAPRTRWCTAYEEGRGTEAARHMLRGFGGIVMVGRAEHLRERRRGPGGKLTLVHCWTHARRKYVECVEAFPQAEQALEIIGGLYAVERRVQGGTREPGAPAAAATAQEPPIIERLHQWACELRALPESALGKAINYMRDLWPGLTRFLRTRGCRWTMGPPSAPCAGWRWGARTTTAAGARRGTEVAALFYSLLETAKLCGVDPKALPARGRAGGSAWGADSSAQPARAARGGLTRRTLCCMS